MKFIDRMTVSSRTEMPLGRFLHEHERACEACHRLDSSPGALILDHLVPARWVAETFEDWLCRQVVGILADHVQTDDWKSVEGDEWAGTRTRCSVGSMTLDAEDREWLLERYSRHPEVLAVWEEACRREHIQQIAA